MSFFAIVATVVILIRCVAEVVLESLNQSSVRSHGSIVPETFREVVDDATYARSVQYTLAKSRFNQLESVYDTLILLMILFSGLLPWSLEWLRSTLGTSASAMAVWLFSIGVALSILGLPFSWYSQFRLEQRFGFNSTTPTLWWTDRIKGVFLATILGFPLLLLVLKVFEWTGQGWWLWAWAALMGFQLLMVVLAPMLILPLFNKFVPLPNGPLRERLLSLGERTGFHAKTIQVMDGSKRSRHSNAFFTGFGRFRKIVLFDTLMEQLGEAELEAVLAHEIGHYKMKHIPKMLAWSALTSLAGFWAVAWLAKQAWFYTAFGFDPGAIAPALLLFALLSGAAGFWLSPFIHWWSRKFEYEADEFAARTVKETESLTSALRKLSEKNLSNLTPHPLYSGFYYSHPTLLEREQALARVSVDAG